MEGAAGGVQPSGEEGTRFTSSARVSVFFFNTHLFTGVPKASGPSAGPDQADCILHYLGQAACQGRLQGGVCKDVAQQRGFAVDISCAAEGQGEKACSEGAGSRKGKQG